MVFTGLRLQIRAGMRRAGFSLLALGFIGLGMVFLIAALWMVLAVSMGAIYATLTMGLFFLGIGVIFLGLANRRWMRVPVAPAPLVAPSRMGGGLFAYAMPAILEAFMVGITAGIASRAASRAGRASDRRSRRDHD